MCVGERKNLASITADVPRDWRAIDGRRLADSLFPLGKGPRGFIGISWDISLNNRETVNHSGPYASSLSTTPPRKH